MQLPILRMRRDLREPVAAHPWPEGIRPALFTPAQAVEVHALLALAYAKGGGKVAPFPEWWAALSGDSEYDPALCFLARTQDNRIVGVAQCWTGALIKDLAVHPDWRRRGVGRALLHQAFQVFRSRGAVAVELKVERDNPSGAVRFYEGLGMSVVPD